MRLALDAPKSLNTERIPAVLFAFCAALLLVIDVATGHQHTVLTCGAAAGLLLLSAVCYFVTAECCSFTQTQAELDSKVGKLLLLMLVCVMFLDGWLYEEATYNHWGHSANVLKEERLAGAVAEICVAALTVYIMYLHFRRVREAAAAVTAKGSMV